MEGAIHIKERQNIWQIIAVNTRLLSSPDGGSLYGGTGEVDLYIQVDNNRHNLLYFDNVWCMVYGVWCIFT